MEWINVKDRLPKDEKNVLCLYRKYERDFHCVAQYYQKGVKRECWNEECNHKDHENGEENCESLGGNWYEDIEQYCSEYDFYLFKREVTHWMPLPKPPTKE